MVEAINEMLEFYRAKNFDMFKDAISLPGLAYKMLMNCPNANFSLFKFSRIVVIFFYVVVKNVISWTIIPLPSALVSIW
jgi:hypothetical protein